MPTVHSVCPLDCPDRCSLEVTVEAGRVAAITGSRVNPVTDGFICAKVRRFPERLYGPDRLLHPMRRSGPKGEGRFERIGWDEAIDAIALRLGAIRQRWGGEAILPFNYGGSNGLLTDGALDARFFRLLGASRLGRTVCAAPTAAAAAALYGKMAGVDFPDFAAARFIIVWGANPRHSNIHLMPYLKAARAAGGRVALIDPRLTMSPQYVDLHLPVYPGTDGAVALAMIGHLERIGRVDRAFLAAHATGWERLLEEARGWTPERAARVARVEPDAITAIAEAYAAADPAVIRCGWGLERNRNGESAVAAVLALPAVAGKFGRPGGGYALSASATYRVDGARLAGGAEPETRVINMNRLGRVLLGEIDPPVRALVVYNANPVCTVPDQNRIREGLRRDDLFTVVAEQVMTDTALYADILLPATTFLEHDELSNSYGTYAVMLGEPVVPPAGEALPNAAIFDRLLRRMGLSRDHPTGEALLREAAAAIGAPLADGAAGREAGGADREGGAADAGAARVDRLRRDRILRFDFPGERPVQFGTVFPRTPDRKARLWPEEALGPDPYRVRDDPGGPAYPLALISPATGKSISSSLAEYTFKEAYLEMHPADAAPRGLRDGGVVRVHNDLGEVRVRVRLSDDLRPGVVYLPKGIWNRHTLNGAVGTALVPDAITEASGGACFNDARVEVSAAE